MKEKFFAGGSILTAVLASSCCIGPLVLAAIGVGGASFFVPIAKYEPIFIGITFAFIGVSYYFTYGRKTACCPGESAKRRLWTQEVPLWVITALAVGLTAFTYTKEYIGGKDGKATLLVSKSDYKIVTFLVEGVTCAGCAETIRSAVSKVSGVKAVNVDVKNGEVAVGFKKDLNFIPIQEVLDALKKKGYNSSLIGG
ncbi:MAG TPA: mercuric transporter MerT family protein [Candidatus Hypogeohydataceae bacterium YC41]